MLEPLRQGLPPTDPSAVAGSASCTLPARYEAVSGARKFTRATLASWELSDRFDDVALVVSELVTNALRHALPCDSPRDPQEPPVRLHLMRWTSRLVCAVRDPSQDSPVAGEAGDSAESGRGLFLVESFSDGWGWHPSPAPMGEQQSPGALRGKVVWALFRLSDKAPSDTSLPDTPLSDASLSSTSLSGTSLPGTSLPGGSALDDELPAGARRDSVQR